MVIDKILVVFGTGWIFSEVMVVSKVETAGERAELIARELLDGMASSGDGNIVNAYGFGGHLDEWGVLFLVEWIAAGEIDGKWLIDGKDGSENTELGG